MSSVNIAAGNSTASFYYGDTKSGTPTITAGATGLTAGTQAEGITALTGTQLGITSTAFSGGASSTATNAFTVTLEDAFGNATTKATATTVNLSTTATATGKFAATSGGATVTSVSLPANTQSVIAYYGDTLVGTPTLTAAASGLTPSGTQQETITGGTPTQLVITSNAFSGAASSSATNAFTVTLEDAFNNITTKTTATTVNLSTTDTGTGTFATTSGGASVTSVSLPANSPSVTAYYGDTNDGTPTITAATTGLTSDTQQETITAGPATQLNIISAPVAGLASTNANLGPLTVQLQDQFGNAVNAPAAGETVALSSTTPNNASFSQTQNAAGNTTATITIASGTSSANFYYGYNATGTPTITAAHTGLTSDTQQEAIGPNQLVITSAPVSGGTSTNGKATLGPITVTLENAGGTPITLGTATVVNLTSSSNGTKEFSATSGGTNITTITIAAGSSTATFYYGDSKRGSPTITTASTGLTSGTQQETIT